MECVEGPRRVCHFAPLRVVGRPVGVADGTGRRRRQQPAAERRVEMVPRRLGWPVGISKDDFAAARLCSFFRGSRMAGDESGEEKQVPKPHFDEMVTKARLRQSRVDFNLSGTSQRPLAGRRDLHICSPLYFLLLDNEIFWSLSSISIHDMTKSEKSTLSLPIGQS